jgi:aspartate oxidase
MFEARQTKQPMLIAVAALDRKRATGNHPTSDYCHAATKQLTSKSSSL